jgi:hypothetical protein
MKSNRLAIITLPLLLLAVVGCGPTALPPMPISGSVKTVDGQPCVNALVVFHPKDKERVNAAKPVATTDAEGRFQLTTFALNDGAIPGEYGVTIVWPSVGGESSELSLSGEGKSVSPDQLNGNYGNPAAPLIKVTVSAKTNEDLAFVVDPKMEKSVSLDPSLD